MATTRIMPLHVGKGRTESRAISDIKMCIRDSYEAVGRMGFETGNILEPSMGVGNFFGMLPEKMRNTVSYTHLDVYKRQTIRKSAKSVELIPMQRQSRKPPR